MASITSKAVRIEQHGGPEQLKLVDVSVGDPGPGEICIRHKAIGLNYIDVYQRSGLYPFAMPLHLGMEASGVIEAVGEAHWPAYFKTLFDRLKPGGAAAIQGITILEENYDAYRNGVDFIQRYIFPGGMLLTKEIMRDQTRKAGLIFEKMECFGQSYARTLKMWHDRFEEAWPRIQPLGFDERFRKLWKLYLCYCEAGFTEGVIDVGIYKLRKPA